jgi:hypothetical protein
MLARRLLMLAAVLMVLTALAAGIAPRESVDPGTPLRTGGPVLEPTGTTVARSISAERGSDSRVRVRRGDQLELEVDGNVIDTVLLERLDRLDGIDPSTPARFDLLVDAPAGVYPIKLVDSDIRIGRIEVAG